MSYLCDYVSLLPKEGGEGGGVKQPARTNRQPLVALSSSSPCTGGTVFHFEEEAWWRWRGIKADSLTLPFK